MVADSLELKAQKSDSTDKKSPTKLQKRENTNVRYEHFLELLSLKNLQFTMLPSREKQGEKRLSLVWVTGDAGT